jgi:hypothetical protein
MLRHCKTSSPARRGGHPGRRVMAGRPGRVRARTVGRSRLCRYRWDVGRSRLCRYRWDERKSPAPEGAAVVLGIVFACLAKQSRCSENQDHSVHPPERDAPSEVAGQRCRQTVSAGPGVDCLVFPADRA